MSQMLKSSSVVALATLISRILGLGREMAYAQLMGNGLVASAFSYAFTIPNLLRRLLGEGALTAAFIPHFKQKEKLEGEAQMWESANAVVCGLILVLSAVVLLFIAVSSGLIASGLLASKTALMLDLLRVMCPYVLLVCLAAIFMAMLNARGHFFVPALGATMLNIVMIASVFWLAPRMGKTLERQVFGVAIGVVLAGFAQCFYQVPLLLKDGYRLRWVNPFKNESVKVVSRQMIPGVVGIAAFQINVLISQGMGFWVADHIVSSFNYAVRLMELPQGLFGASLATYLLPTLSGLAADKKFPEFRSTLRQGVSYVCFANLIAAILLVVLAEPIIRLLFQRGSFDALATQRVTTALWGLAPGLLAFSTVNILARAFYALGDTSTPTRISIFCLMVNLVVVCCLVWSMQQAGMGIANTVSSFLNMGLLGFALKKKLGKLEFGEFLRSLPGLLLCGLFAGAVAWLTAKGFTRHFGEQGLAIRAATVFVPAGLAGAIYAGLAWWFRLGCGHEVVDSLVRRIRRP